MAVSVFCQPLEGMTVLGPPSLLVGQQGIYQALPQPLTASLPLTFSWSSGSVGPAATYSWPEAGSHTLTVTGTNICGGAWRAVYTVQVLEEWPHGSYLPLIVRRSG
ncbi:MAG: PKD domain-containing protein [Chloroflexia bacterium]|nr:PKD domain-containing protein [Chloroflexia bacterium]